MNTTPRSRARITAMVNQKGGVGKTTTTVNVGGALSAKGNRVLLVDLDPQGHLTVMMAMRELIRPYGLGSHLIGKLDQMTDDARDINNLIVPHSDGLDVLPTAIDMVTVADDIRAVRGREERLGKILKPLLARYDHIVIDCPPSLDTLTDNALTCSDDAVVLVQLEDTSMRALELLFAQISAINDELRDDDPLEILGLVVSMLERGVGGLPRSNIARSVLEALEGLPYPILASVPRGIPVTEAARFGQAVEQYAPHSEHAQAFRDVAGALT
jgi:chromosome partitioning protein